VRTAYGGGPRDLRRFRGKLSQLRGVGTIAGFIAHHVLLSLI
jgi:hypothetical protein